MQKNLTMKGLRKKFSFQIDLAIWLIPIWAIISIITTVTDIDYSAFIEPVFLFTFLGVFTGFALTLFVHIVSMIQGIKTRFKDKVLEFDAFYEELKHGIMVLFYGIIIFGIVIVVSPFFKQSFNLMGYDVTIKSLFESLSMAIFVLTIISLFDLIRVSFKVSQDFLKNT